MKKRNLIIALSAMTLLTSCGEDEPSDSTLSETTGSSLKASDFATKFNAKVNASIKKGEEDIGGDYNIDYAADHVSYWTLDAKGQFFEKDSNGGVNLATLDEHNEKSSETVLGEKFDDAFPNVFATLATTHASEKEVDLAVNNALNDLGTSFVKLFLKNAPLEAVTEATGSISFNENVALAMTLKDAAGTDVTLTATFVDPASYQETKLETLPETDASKALKTALDSIKEGNYTVKVKEGETVKETLYVNSDRLLVTEGTSSKGFLKNETGYDAVLVSGDEIAEDGSSTDTFSSLLPDYDFASEVFVDGSVSPLVDEEDVLTHLQFTVLTSYYQNAEIQSLKLANDKKSMVLTLENAGKTTSFEWSNIGTTALSVDISNVTVKKTWASAGYKEIDTQFKAAFGTNTFIPYWDIGLDWDIDTAYTESNKNMTVSAYDFDEEADSDAVALYADKMKKAGYKELTEEERKSLKEQNGNLVGGLNDFVDYHIYHVNNSIVEIIKDDSLAMYGEPTTYSIYVSPDKGWHE